MYGLVRKNQARALGSDASDVIPRLANVTTNTLFDALRNGHAPTQSPLGLLNDHP
jgi:hypothetical protein